jgi:hypothetical protein
MQEKHKRAMKKGHRKQTIRKQSYRTKKADNRSKRRTTGAENRSKTQTT